MYMLLLFRATVYRELIVVNRVLLFCLVVVVSLWLVSTTPSEGAPPCPGCEVWVGFDYSGAGLCVLTCPIPDPFGGYCLYAADLYTPRFERDPDKEPHGSEEVWYVSKECLPGLLYGNCLGLQCPDDPQIPRMFDIMIVPICKPCT